LENKWLCGDHRQPGEAGIDTAGLGRELQAAEKSKDLFCRRKTYATVHSPKALSQLTISFAGPDSGGNGGESSGDQSPERVRRRRNQSGGVYNIQGFAIAGENH
jgi:hypothetical protein